MPAPLDKTPVLAGHCLSTTLNSPMHQAEKNLFLTVVVGIVFAITPIDYDFV